MKYWSILRFQDLNLIKLQIENYFCANQKLKKNLSLLKYILLSKLKIIELVCFHQELWCIKYQIYQAILL